ncbi:MAG: GDP-L-fucose synthase [Rhodospirillales bacterium]|nr:GDP-L-fucose synthase [Rhodospirillales bacterium]
MEDGWLAAPFDLTGKRVWVAGHSGMVGSALVRRLGGEDCDILSVDHAALDLRNQAATRGWVIRNKPDVVVIAAAKVGGIGANAAQPADFLYDNVMIAANIIHAAYEAGVEKLLFLGSSCIYPKEAAQPIKEEALLSGPLEQTNEAYAIAKIAGLKLCEAYRAQYGCDYISAMPCNLYGPGDTFDERSSHVIPALMMKAQRAVVSGADVLEVWGSGQPLREFLHVDDLADACVFLLKHYSGALPVNVGSGEEISIAALAAHIAEIAGFSGAIKFDDTKPDGTYRKLMDSSRLKQAGWMSKVVFYQGLKGAYDWYVRHFCDVRKSA